MKTMIEKIFSARILALMVAMFATSGAWADGTIAAGDAVTGSAESYTYYFTGANSGDWSDTGNWANADASAYSKATSPALQGSDTWDPILFDGNRCSANKTISATNVDGWNLRMGLYNGVTVTMSGLKYWKASGNTCYANVDSTSTLIYDGSASGLWDSPVELTVANANGIVFNNQFLANRADNAKVYYTLIGAGSVKYKSSVNGYVPHYIKKVAIELEHPASKELKKKTLVTFTGQSVSWKTENTVVMLSDMTIPFADGDIPDSKTITVAYGVGSCEIVRESDGIYLYYVDGPAPRSININSCQAGDNNYKVSTSQSTLIGSIPQAAWSEGSSNGNSTFTTTTGCDSSGAYALGATVSVQEYVYLMSNHGQDGWNGSNYGTLAYTLDILKSWLATKDNSEKDNSYMKVTGIPYAYYDAIVIMSGSTVVTTGCGGKFSPLKITAGNLSETQYTSSSSGFYKTTTGSDNWGTRGVDKVVYGTNALRVDGLTGDLTIKYDAFNNGIAAVQIVEHAPQTCTWTVQDVSGTKGGYLNDNSAGNWDVVPGEGDNAIINVSEDSTLVVDAAKNLGTVTITTESESPVTLTVQSYGSTLAATSISVAANVTLKLATSGAISAPVAVASGATFDINVATTWSSVISGAGSVRVSANAVTFGAANTFTGGLTVASGGLAKSSNAAGFGNTATTIVVSAGGTLDLSGSNGYNYSYNISGTGIDGNGAIINTGAANSYYIYSGVKGLTLSADATVNCNHSWGIYGGHTISLQDHNLTLVGGEGSEWYIQGCHMNPGSSNTGKLIVSNGVTVKTANGNGTGFNVDVQTGATLDIQSVFPVRDLTCSGTIKQSAGTITCSGAMGVSGTFNQTGGTLTCNSTLSVTGTMTAGATVNCNGNLTVGGTINVNGTFTVASTKTITKTGSGIINIGSAGIVDWINTAWTDSVGGDVFSADSTGMLILDGTGGNWIHTATSSFGGIIKVVSRDGDRYVAFNGTDSAMFENRPELMLACGASGNQGYLRFGVDRYNKAITVRNLNGYGRVNAGWGSTSQNGEYSIDTLQTRDTTFAGTFIKDSSFPSPKPSLIVRGTTETINTLTLSGASTTEGTLRVLDNAKVAFADTGSWSSGIVTVDDGYLESQNDTSIATTLNLNDGATIVLPLDSEDNEVVLQAGTVNLASSGTVNVDLSAWSFEEDEEKTIVTATSTLSASAAATVLKPVSGNFSFRADGNSIKATRLGASTWTDGSWSYDPSYSKESAVVNVVAAGSTLNLGANSYSFETLTLSGSEGTLSITGTGKITAQNLVVPAGVTLNVSSSIEFSSATGSGTINVPAGATYTMADVTCEVKVTVQGTGTLRTSGDTTLASTASTFAGNSDLIVVDGTTELKSAGIGISGRQTIESGAKLKLQTWDALNYNASSETYVKGELVIDGQKISLEDNSGGNNIHLYPGAKITGTGYFDFCGGKFTVEKGAGGTIGKATMNLTGNGDSGSPIRLADWEIDIADGMEFEVNGNITGGCKCIKKGAGTLIVSPTKSWNVTGGVTVEAGFVKLGSDYALGDSNSRTSTVTVEDGAAIDVNGYRFSNQIYLEGDGPDGNGALINNRAGMGSDCGVKISLTGDASWGGSQFTHFGASSVIALNGYTFTKKGTNPFPLNNTVMSGSGKIVVAEGEFQNNGGNNKLDGIDLEIGSGATLNMAGGSSLRIRDFASAGTISGTSAKLVVNGTYSVNGDQSISKLEMVTNSAIAFATTSSKLTVTTLTFALPENGKVLLDVAGLNIPSEGMELINCNSTDNFSVSDGYYLDVVGGSVYAYQNVVNITVPVIANTTVTVTVGGVEQVGVDGDGVKTYSVPYGSAVVVTYTAVSGYQISGTATYNIASATTDATITVDQNLSSDLIVATFNGTSYTTLQAAVNAWAGADMMVAFANPVRLSCDVPDGLTIPAHNSGNSAVELQLNGDNHTLTGSVTISANATLKPSNITLSGDLTVNGTVDVTTTLSVGGDVTFGDGSCIMVTTLSDSVAKLTATGDLTVVGDLLVYLNSDSLEAGTYLLATGSSVDADDAVATVQLNGTEDPAWTFSATETSLVLKAVAAEVEGVKYETFAEAVEAAAGSKTIELLASASYTLSVGETLIVDAGSFTMTVTAPAGYAVAQSGSDVVTYTTQKYVAKLRNPNVGSTTYADEVYYTSLAAAVADVVEQTQAVYADYVATVTLLDDITLDAAVTVGKKMKLDLNGKTLTASGINAINNSTKLTVQGSSGSINVTSGSSVVLTAAAATLTVSGVTLSPMPTSGVDLMYVKATTSDGTTTYSLQAAGEMDGTTAIITDTTETIIIPDSATAVKLYPSTSSFTLVGTAAQIMAGSLYAKYTINDVVYEQNITEAFNAALTPGEGTKYSDALVFAGQTLGGVDKTVLVGSEQIKVIPQVAASSPMTLDDTVGGDTEASFTIKTIPGLYYAVQTGAFDAGVWVPDEYGDAVQATSDSTSVTAPEFSGTVQYYKIAVGLSAADVSPTP